MSDEVVPLDVDEALSQEEEMRAAEVAAAATAVIAALPPPAPPTRPAGPVGRVLARIDALPLETIVPLYLRVVSVAWLLTGIGHWTRIVGYLPWRGRMFADMPVEWQSGIVFYGVADLVTAVGLWLATSWGVILWLFAVAVQVFTHSALTELFGERPIRVPFHLVTVAVYLLLFWRLRAKRRAEAH